MKTKKTFQILRSIMYALINCFFLLFLTLSLSICTILCFAQGGGAAINITGSAADNSAMLDVSSTTQGVLIPRMITAQRDAIVSPAQGLMIYNITTKCFEFYENGGWYNMGCTCSYPDIPFVELGSGATSAQITANWNAASGATHYHLDVSTSSSFANFITGFSNKDVSNVTTYNVTGLSSFTTYYYRVRAENACGSSGNSGTITYATIAIFVCGDPLSISHIIGVVAPETKTVSYGTVLTSLSGASKCWITRNLGATNQATSATDNTEASAGWYWQFNRKQGYKVGPTPAWTITSINENSDWLAANDPCTIELGTGWRIPSITEWDNADANGQTGGWDSYNETYADVLKLHTAGELKNDGSLNGRGTDGQYWSSTQYPSSTQVGKYLDIGNSYSTSTSDFNNKAYGFSVRCLKD